jgi:hypothetical protein
LQPPRSDCPRSLFASRRSRIRRETPSMLSQTSEDQILGL